MIKHRRIKQKPFKNIENNYSIDYGISINRYNEDIFTLFSVLVIIIQLSALTVISLGKFERFFPF